MTPGIFDEKGQELFSMTDAAKKLGTSRQTLYAWLRDKRIFATEVAGKPYITKQEIDRVNAQTEAKV